MIRPALKAQPARAAARVALMGLLILGIEYSRGLAGRVNGLAVASLLVGGLALCALAWRRRPADLGLGTTALVGRVLGGLGLAAVLLLPAAARWGGGPLIPPDLAVAAIAVSVGEELAFRGVLFSDLEGLGGPVMAVVGSTALWTAAHALSHPAQFLPAVAAAGLLLGLWRWACRDLVAPIVGHSIADLSL